MIYDYLLRVPEGTTVAELPGAAQSVIARLRAEWPTSGIMPGTVPSGGWQLSHTLAPVTPGQLEALIEQYGLPWAVVGCQSDTSAPRPIDPDDVVDFLPPRMVDYDTDTETDITEPVTAADLRAGVVQLHIYAGHRPWQFEPEPIEE